MTRENVDAKARRYLTEGRLVVEAVDSRRIVATVRGAGALHTVGYSPGGWACTCDAHGRCSHLVALQLITVAPVIQRARRAAS